ncbi:MAG: 1-deoxy-D-xylulose-5-phosphate reductoisomerase [Candidatus Ancillula sp.]|jgi:1-deoxy-D-xylulose-5-phosphate reductoisomerase|nr:1-deoxy-D-xylulose-5-phosphate reductoisomerase [Candidatus Ancillula sp.]
MQKVVVLGSTGSIGQQALDVIRRYPDQFEVVGLSAKGTRKESRTQFYADVDEFLGGNFSRAVLESEHGFKAITELAQTECSVVLNGISGVIGLKPTLAALSSPFAPKLALANKESLVAGGHLVQKMLGENLLERINPVDSEHSAIWQALEGQKYNTTSVKRLILTASGGPFRGFTKEQLQKVTVKEALKHPTWNMGPLVTINSATMMNKALELIEAVYLFGVDEKQVEITVHPQSKVHSMVEFIDGSIIMQTSNNDMRLPIALGLSYPNRLESVICSYDFTTSSTLEFEPLDEDVFRAIKLARNALRSGPLFPVVMNTANELAVDAFLSKKISFLQIVELVEEVVEQFSSKYNQPSSLTLENIEHAIKWSVEECERVIRSVSL